MRFYFSQFTGDGVTTHYSVPMHPTQEGQVSSPYNLIDTRIYPELADEYAFVWTNNTDAEHQALLTNPLVIYLPFEDVNGVIVPLDSPVSEVTSTNWEAIQATLTTQDILLDGVTTSWTVRQVIDRVIRCSIIRNMMFHIDLVDLSLPVSTMPANTFKAAAKRLSIRGFDISAATPTTSLHDVVLSLVTQPAMDNYLTTNSGYSID